MEEAVAEDASKYENIKRSIFLTDRPSRSNDEQLQCECTLVKGDKASGCCGDDECLNRMMQIECGSNCRGGKRCRNQRFQRYQYAKAEIFDAGKKGNGLRTTSPMEPGDFVGEYVGEVFELPEFERRHKAKMEKTKQQHMYFMFLTPHLVIDATDKGNKCRFLNHSCDPNCELMKWMVNGEVRVGFFAIESIESGVELCFDYKYERYGEEAHECFCGSANCRGELGAEKEEGGSRRKSGGSSVSAIERARKKLQNALVSFKDTEGGLHPKSVVQFMKKMHTTDIPEDRTLILEFLNETVGSTDEFCLSQFLRFHGLSFMKKYLDETEETPIQTLCLQIIEQLPVGTRNVLDKSKIEDSVKGLMSVDDSSLSENATKLLEKWSTLKLVATIARDEETKSTEYDVPREWLKNFRESTLRSLERDHCVKLTFSKDNSNPDSKALKITGTVANQDDAKVAIKDLIQSSVESKLRADEERKEKEMRRSSIRSDRSESKRRGDDLGSPRSRMGSTSGGNLFPSFTEDDGAAPMELSGQDPPKSQWQQVMDENGRPYYWNVKTDEVKWETPEPEKLQVPTVTTQADVVKEKADKPAIKLSAGLEAFLEKQKAQELVTKSKTVEPSGGDALTPAQILASFKKNVSDCVKKTLTRYRKKDCQVGKITNDADFKHLCRKITHIVVQKETAKDAPKDASGLDDDTKHKVKNFVKSYMKKTGAVYARGVGN